MTTSIRYTEPPSEKDTTSLEGSEGVARKSIDSHAMTLMALALVILATQAVHMAAHRGGGTTQAAVRSTIDPNRAPWCEFTVLPRIGESLARRITEYRMEASNRTDGDARRPVFDSAASLDEVRGIGPKTVLRIAPFLRFD
ncbi:MAG: helix-hairpin-helix domain-containing protein [Planctomycetes bacterium]|nr:helix-hairpin-helix domain-containing protein [Planctomycetota bacterium]